MGVGHRDNDGLLGEVRPGNRIERVEVGAYDHFQGGRGSGGGPLSTLGGDGSLRIWPRRPEKTCLLTRFRLGASGMNTTPQF